MLERRRFLIGLGAALAAPAIVKFESLMPVRAPKLVATKFYVVQEVAHLNNNGVRWLGGKVAKTITREYKPIVEQMGDTIFRLTLPEALEMTPGMTFSVAYG